MCRTFPQTSEGFVVFCFCFCCISTSSLNRTVCEGAHKVSVRLIFQEGKLSTQCRSLTFCAEQVMCTWWHSSLYLFFLWQKLIHECVGEASRDLTLEQQGLLRHLSWRCIAAAPRLSGTSSRAMQHCHYKLSWDVHQGAMLQPHGFLGHLLCKPSWDVPQNAATLQL